MTEVTLYPYQARYLYDALTEEAMHLEDIGEENRLPDITEALENIDRLTGLRGNECRDVEVPATRPVSDALMRNIYDEARRSVEDGPEAVGEIAELGKIYQEVFGRGPEQEVVPRDEGLMP